MIKELNNKLKICLSTNKDMVVHTKNVLSNKKFWFDNSIPTIYLYLHFWRTKLKKKKRIVFKSIKKIIFLKFLVPIENLFHSIFLIIGIPFIMFFLYIFQIWKSTEICNSIGKNAGQKWKKKIQLNHKIIGKSIGSLSMAL